MAAKRKTTPVKAKTKTTKAKSAAKATKTKATKAKATKAKATKAKATKAKAKATVPAKAKAVKKTVVKKAPKPKTKAKSTAKTAAKAKSNPKPTNKAKAKTKVKAVPKTPSKVKTPAKDKAKATSKTEMPAKAKVKTKAAAKPVNKAKVKAVVPKRTVAKPKKVQVTPVVKPARADALDDYMNEEQREHFRGMLLDWKHQLMEEVDRTVSHMKDQAANDPDPADRATQEEEFSLELKTRDRERKLIKKIDSTIELIDQNDYGYCDSCGIEIGIHRLEARPTATQCIDCKTLDEIREKQITG